MGIGRTLSAFSAERRGGALELCGLNGVDSAAPTPGITIGTHVADRTQYSIRLIWSDVVELVVVQSDDQV